MLKIIFALICILVINKNSYSQVQYLTFNPEDNNSPVTYHKCNYSDSCWSLNSSLQLRCDTMYEISDTFFIEYGLKSKFRGYQIECPISLQTSCNGGSMAEIDTFLWLYNIYIAQSNHEDYLDLMIDSLYREVVSKQKELDDSYPDFWLKNYFLYNRGDFLFYNKTSSYYLIHFNGFLVKIVSKGEKNNRIRSNVGLSAFMREICNFRGDSYESFFEGNTLPVIHPTDFRIWYESDKFKK